MNPAIRKINWFSYFEYFITRHGKSLHIAGCSNFVSDYGPTFEAIKKRVRDKEELIISKLKKNRTIGKRGDFCITSITFTITISFVISISVSGCVLILILFCSA